MTAPPLTERTYPRAPYLDGGASRALTDIRHVVEQAIDTHPRSLQTRIGPSELGTPCDHCLAAKLAGWPQTDQSRPWLPTVGTAMHAWLEEQACVANVERLKAGDPDRWLCEERVTVGQIGGVDITGSTDLYDLATGTVIDYKLVGDNSLRTYRTGPSVVYRTQAHLYGLGWANAGFQVAAVAIWFLPRNRPRLDDAIAWYEPWNRTIAEEALARANWIHNNLTALAAISLAERDAWISKQPRAPRCFDCNRYPDRTQTDNAQAGFTDLLPTPAAHK